MSTRQPAGGPSLNSDSLETHIKQPDRGHCDGDSVCIEAMWTWVSKGPGVCVTGQDGVPAPLLKYEQDLHDPVVISPLHIPLHLEQAFDIL